MGRRVLNLLVVGVTLAGVLIFWVVPLTQRLSRPESFCPESFDSEKVARSSDLGSRAAAYTGPGVHSVTIYEASGDPDSGEVEWSASKPSQEGLPESWNPKYEDDKTVDVQLLLCVYNQKYRGEVSRTLGRCEGYGMGAGDENRVEVDAAPVTYRLYEAASKRLLTKFDLTADGFDRSDCPAQVSYRSDEFPAIWISPKPADIADRLKSFVEAAR